MNKVPKGMSKKDAKRNGLFFTPLIFFKMRPQESHSSSICFLARLLACEKRTFVATFRKKRHDINFFQI